MSLFLVVGLLMLLALSSLFYVVFSSTGSAIKHYDNEMSYAANSSLAEMFIFIDDRRLKLYSGFLFVVLGFFAYLFTQSALVALVLGALVVLIPNLGVSLLKKIRLERFNKELPDALLALSNMLRSGLNLSGAVPMVVEESKGPLGQEFGLFLNELKMGVDFDRALDAMFQRVPLPDLELVVAGMKISREVGGSLADVLARLADTIRKRIEMDGKIKSLTSMGVLQGWVMTLLPMGVGYAIYLIEPETMMKLFTDWRGWIACVAVVTLEYVGYKIIRKIVDIDV